MPEATTSSMCKFRIVEPYIGESRIIQRYSICNFVATEVLPTRSDSGWPRLPNFKRDFHPTERRGNKPKTRYWPHSPSNRTGKSNDLDDFVPERWLSNTTLPTSRPEADEKQDDTDGLEEASYDTNTSGSLFKPIINSFISFSEGVRACPGRRFAQVQITAVITAIFQKYSVELDVSDWASDEEVARMGTAEKAVYQKAAIRAESVLRRCEQRTITLQMRPGEEVPVRFVEKGKERFAGLYELG